MAKILKKLELVHLLGDISFFLKMKGNITENLPAKMLHVLLLAGQRYPG